MGSRLVHGSNHTVLGRQCGRIGHQCGGLRVSLASRDKRQKLTVHGLELVDDLSKGHLVSGNGSLEPGEDSSAKLELFAQIRLGPSVVIQL
jgi:hypothetical protein